MQQINQRTDPAPSRWAYRIERILLTPLYRRLLRIGVPVVLTGALIGFVLVDQDRRDAIVGSFDTIRAKIQSRPEFMIKVVEVDGASPELRKIIQQRFPYDLPVSSFDLELDAFRVAVEGIPAVEKASVRFQREGALTVRVTERMPVVLWRSDKGLWVLDTDGISIAAMQTRMDAPGLPVLAGKGAETVVPEALALLATATPWADRIRGLERIGERRWDLVLDRRQRIMLPEKQAVEALERAIMLNQAQSLLDRDVAAVDLRLEGRPTVRMNKRAIETWRGTMELSQKTVAQ